MFSFIAQKMIFFFFGLEMVLTGIYILALIMVKVSTLGIVATISYIKTYIIEYGCLECFYS